MRYLKIGDWSSAVHDWTLCAFSISEPKYRRSTVIVPGSDGAIDLSDALDGTVHYDPRKITARLENSCGTRQQRNVWISHLVNALDGTVQEIEMPDDPSRYMRGRLRVAVQYNDNAHAAVQITADVDPWKYRKAETVHEIYTEEGEHSYDIRMTDRRPVSPVFHVVNVYESLMIGTHEITEPGLYQFHDIVFRHGVNAVTISGLAAIRVKYREGVL